jgi:DNA-binding NtrC family response regulator
MSILVIDDEEMIRKMAARILESVGYHVHLSGYWEESRQTLRESAADIKLVLLDLNLDDASGLELLAAVRAEAPDLPVILSSGEMIDLSLIPPPLRTGIALLHKPYSAADLIEAVAAAVKKEDPII